MSLLDLADLTSHKAPRMPFPYTVTVNVMGDTLQNYAKGQDCGHQGLEKQLACGHAQGHEETRRHGHSLARALMHASLCTPEMIHAHLSLLTTECFISVLLQGSSAFEQ